ncbi:hypothetical protein PIB30_071638 [Stylosanthes scabra]|uniref:Replication protein A 70 kDa DNA-binding subunit B/D first OB fold domain-containing protein n=1 Tax=Stylosanthes scabra TaxID=79078 RepID=A0ABU6VQN2_9FABA|nr:hypothetical protein [Stylosanthes scabra]
MASNPVVPGLSEQGHRVADIRPVNLGCKLVVAVVRLYDLPNQWISKEATSMEMVLQDQETVIRENEIYSMQNFVIQKNVKPPRTTPHQYKLSFYAKTEVRTLDSTTFQFNRFRFMSFPYIEAMPGLNNKHQIGMLH